MKRYSKYFSQKKLWVYLYILLVFLLVSCNKFELKNQNFKIKPGDVYLHSFDWDTQDPFKEIEIDTVEVLEIRGDYIKWQEKGKKYSLSGKLKYFKHGIKPCN